MTDVLERSADVRCDHDSESFLLIDAMRLGHKLRQCFVQSQKSKLLPQYLANQDGTFVLEELIGMRSLTFLLDSEMKYVFGQDTIHNGRKQVGDGEENDVIFDVERTTRSSTANAALGDVNLFQRPGAIGAVLQGLSKPLHILLKVEDVILIAENVGNKVVLLVVVNVIRCNL